MSEIPPPTIPPATPPPPGGGSYTPPPPPPHGGGGYTPAPGSDRTMMIVLSYLGLLALVPYLTKKDDPEVLWHAKNGIGLLIVDVVVIAAYYVVQAMIGQTVLGCGLVVIGCVLPLALLALHIYCIVQAVGGKRPRIPAVTDFAEKTL